MAAAAAEEPRVVPYWFMSKRIHPRDDELLQNRLEWCVASNKLEFHILGSARAYLLGESPPPADYESVVALWQKSGRMGRVISLYVSLCQCLERVGLPIPTDIHMVSHRSRYTDLHTLSVYALYNPEKTVVWLRTEDMVHGNSHQWLYVRAPDQPTIWYRCKLTAFLDTPTNPIQSSSS